MKTIIVDNVITVETPAGPIYEIRVGIDSIDVSGKKEDEIRVGFIPNSREDTLDFKSLDRNKIRIKVV